MRFQIPLSGHINRLFFTLITGFMLLPLSSSGQLNPDSILFKTTESLKEFFYRQQDTSYIANLRDELSVRVMSVSKSNYLLLRDKNQKSRLRYRPDRRFNLGVGVTYSWFSFDAVFNLGIGEKDQTDNTKIIDIKANVFTNKHYISGFYQYYLGYKLSNSTVGNVNQDTEKLRYDIRTVHVGIDYMYVVDYQKFSLKAPFTHNEIQKKSAGSPVLGIGLSLNLVDGDSSLIPQSQQQYFDDILNFTDFYVTNISFNVGYFYSFVVNKEFYLTLGLIPGLSFSSGDYQYNGRQRFGLNINPKMQSMSALGWSGRKFYVSFEFSGGVDFFRPGSGVGVDFGRGKLKLMVGYRFKSRN